MVSFIKETKTVESLTWLILAFYGLYALFGIGFNGLLFSMAIGLIAYSVVDSMLIVAAAVILSGILWRTVIAPRVVDAFADVVVSKLPDGQEAYPRSAVAQIVKRVTGFGEDGVEGVGSKMTEGFADVKALDQARPDAGSTAADKTAAVSTGSSTQASVSAATASKELAQATPSKEAAKEATAAAQGAPKADSAIPTIGMQSGKPDEKKKDGIHVDAASTLMNALNTLDTKTIENMTADTRNLLETQKSLMGMLQSMKPLLSDSQDMMSTFNSMFGSAAGAGTAAAGAAPIKK